jgi:hypothetical protein
MVGVIVVVDFVLTTAEGVYKVSQVKKRDGVPTLLKLAKLSCKALTKFTPYLTVKYSSNPALLAALAAAQGACAVLDNELEKVREYGD